MRHRNARPESRRQDAARQVKEACASFLAGPPHPALHGLEIDDDARGVLDRLWKLGRRSDSITAAEAIVAALPPDGWPVLFADCILAERRARLHAKGIEDAQAVLGRSEKAKEHLAGLSSFLGLPKMRTAITNDPVVDAFLILRDAVSMRHRMASDHLRMFSRKKTNEAGRANGAGWIKESLAVVAARAGHTVELQHAAAIATAALGMGEVTTEAVRKALGMRSRLRRPRIRRVQGKKPD